MYLDEAYGFLNESTYQNIKLPEAAGACMDFALSSASPEFFEEGEKGSKVLNLSEEERKEVLRDFYQEKRIKLIREFCAAFVSKAQSLSLETVKKRKKDGSDAVYKAHQILSATKTLGLFMATVDLTCINGLYLACTRMQKKLGTLSRAAAKEYNEGKIYSEQIGQKADIKTRNYSLLDMFMYPSGKKPVRRRD